jgi:hypothetical protein
MYAPATYFVIVSHYKQNLFICSFWYVPRMFFNLSSVLAELVLICMQFFVCLRYVPVPEER